MLERKLRILIADDSFAYRSILTAAVERTGLAVITQSASNGLAVLERMQLGHVDVVLMDVHMPHLDGLETLRRLRRVQPRLPVLLLSGNVERMDALEELALQAGAFAFLPKPAEELFDRNMEQLSDRLRGVFLRMSAAGGTPPVIGNGSEEAERKDAQANVSATPVPPATLNRTVSLSGFGCGYGAHQRGLMDKAPDVILIAASTGGPQALEQVLGGLPAGFAKPILIVQHMPPDFTFSLGEMLNRRSLIRVAEGREGDRVRSGQALLAPGGRHMQVARDDRGLPIVRMTAEDPVHGMRPAADVLFRTAASIYAGARVLTVILTGMGQDSRDGVAQLKRDCLCHCITQSEESCVVYGMPRSVTEAGLSDETIHLHGVAGRIQELAELGGG